MIWIYFKALTIWFSWFQVWFPFFCCWNKKRKRRPNGSTSFLWQIHDWNSIFLAGYWLQILRQSLNFIWKWVKYILLGDLKMMPIFCHKNEEFYSNEIRSSSMHANLYWQHVCSLKLLSIQKWYLKSLQEPILANYMKSFGFQKYLSYESGFHCNLA